MNRYLTQALVSLSLVFTSIFSAYGAPWQAPSTIYRQGDIVVKQLVSPSFDKLPLPRKIFAYYLSKAIEAGRDIAWQQASREGIAIRNLLERMYRQARYFSYVSRAGFEEYLFQVETHHGNYDENKNEKFVPKNITRDTFFSLVRIAQAQERKQNPQADLETEARRLEKHIFDENFRKPYLAAAPLDLVADSNSNFYGPGTTEADLNALPKETREHFLSYISREDGETRVKYHRINGRFNPQLQLINYYFNQAKRYANPQEVTIISAYQQAIYSGKHEDQLAADALWLQNKPTDLDFVITFVEYYQDPLGARGMWEGFVMLLDQDEATIQRVETIRRNFDRFEQDTPFAPEFRKAAGLTPPKAEGAYLLYTGGDNGEQPFAGVNLPNDPGLKEKYGSKSYTALNVMHEIGGKQNADKEAQLPYFYLEKYHDAYRKLNERLVQDLQVEFHEILGHGSSKNNPGVTDQHIKEYYNPLEEGRAETASLYHMTGSLVQEVGLLPQGEAGREFATIAVVDFFTKHLLSFARLSETQTQLRQAHQWARQVMLNRLAHDGVLRIVVSSRGIPQVDVLNLAKVRESLGRLWNEIQHSKSTGNYEQAQSLFEQWGIYTDEHRQWRRAILQAYDDMMRPKDRPVFLNPRFAVSRRRDTITDVRLKYYRSTKHLGTFLNRQVRTTQRNNQRLEECQLQLSVNTLKSHPEIK